MFLVRAGFYSGPKCLKIKWPLKPLPQPGLRKPAFFRSI
jgi:hypothetical protein